MSDRRKIPKPVETNVLLASGRRCCLCLFLNGRDEVRKGQIAHLNQDPSDCRFENLVWLCLEHHDEYDSRTSQSKGLTQKEVEAYRAKLYERDPDKTKTAAESEYSDAPELLPLPHLTEFQAVRHAAQGKLDFLREQWRYPLWQVANMPELFAYKSANRSDGVCLVERIDIPDGRIVVACIAIAGNPGNSITNAVEDICFQVCERFEIPPHRLVWLEHYDYDSDDEWDMVTFQKLPPVGPFTNPKWTTMTSELWKTLRLRPKKKLVRRYNCYESKLTKLFSWPSEAILDRTDVEE